MFISSTGTTICGWPWPHCIVAQAQTHVIIILSNIGRVEKDCHDHKYTSFILGPRSCRGKRTHKSLILAQRLVGEIKQRQTASPSRDGAPDKDLSMAHFSGTEGWKEGGVVWRERGMSWSNCAEVQSGGFQFSSVEEKLWLDKQHLQTSHVPLGQVALQGHLGNGADSSKKGCYFQSTFQRPPPPPTKKKKKFLHQPIRLAEVQTELHWHSPMLMILGILIYKKTKKALHGKRPFIGANPVITVPQVEVDCWSQCLVALILKPGSVKQVIWPPFSLSNKSVKSNGLHVKCHPEVQLTSFC